MNRDWAYFDYHVHTSYSDGRCGLEEVINIEKNKGISRVVIADHYDPEAFNHMKISFNDYINKLEAAQKKFSKDDIKIGKGLEIMVTDGGFPLDKKMLDNLDLVIASVHRINIDKEINNWLDKSYWEEHKRLALKALDNPEVDIMGHIEGYLNFPREEIMPASLNHLEATQRVADKYFDNSWYQEIIKRAKQNKIAVEIHCPTETPRLEKIKYLVENDVLLTIGSDGHGKREIGNIEYAHKVIEKLNLKEHHFKIIL